MTLPLAFALLVLIAKPLWKDMFPPPLPQP
jgi:hypothetical protein